MTRTLHILTLLLALTLVACTAGEDNYVDPHAGTHAESPEALSTPLAFAAYVGRNSRTAATPDAINDAKSLAEVGGFGVFGYTQGRLNFDSYSLDAVIPNFFNNQQVWDSHFSDAPHQGEIPDLGTWTYAPVKYYDNNDGTKHSFFAYAPYASDADIVYINGKAPQIRYSIDQDIDLLWAEPTKNMTKPAVGTEVTFNFQHALTKATFHVVPFFDMAHADDSHPLPVTNILPDGTTVKVRSIHLNGTIPYVGLMDTETGQWITDTKGGYFNVPGATAATWTGTPGGTPLTTHTTISTSKLIPTRDVTIEVIYDVITGTGLDKSHITNKAVSHQTFDLAQGKAYDLYLDLGLTSVKFTAKVVDWTVSQHSQVDIILIETSTASVLSWEDIEGDADIPVGL